MAPEFFFTILLPLVRLMQSVPAGWMLKRLWNKQIIHPDLRKRELFARKYSLDWDMWEELGGWLVAELATELEWKWGNITSAAPPSFIYVLTSVGLLSQEWEVSENSEKHVCELAAFDKIPIKWHIHEFGRVWYISNLNYYLIYI